MQKHGIAEWRQFAAKYSTSDVSDVGSLETPMFGRCLVGWSKEKTGWEGVS
jgi:hypothetical protein